MLDTLIIISFSGTHAHLLPLFFSTSSSWVNKVFFYINGQMKNFGFSLPNQCNIASPLQVLFCFLYSRDFLGDVSFFSFLKSELQPRPLVLWGEILKFFRPEDTRISGFSTSCFPFCLLLSLGGSWISHCCGWWLRSLQSAPTLPGPGDLVAWYRRNSFHPFAFKDFHLWITWSREKGIFKFPHLTFGSETVSKP